MSHRADPRFLDELKKYGTVNIESCFNCGNCTAVCTLSQGSTAFPRRVIRYAQLGQRDHLAASREVWLCYHCADCSETCPRQAEPGAFMAAARRFTLAVCDPTKLAQHLNSSGKFAAAVLVAVCAVLVAVLLAPSPGLPEGRLTSQELLRFIPFETIHWLGLGVVVAAAAVVTASLTNLLWMISRAPVPGAPDVPRRPGRFPLRDALRAAGVAAGEVLRMRRFRDCGAADATPRLPLRRWFVHYAIMAGMVGLAAATAFDYLVKTPGKHVALWYPSRAIGTIAGLLLVYGTTAAIVQRLLGHERSLRRSGFWDWLTLVLLWTIGASGFVLEVGEYVPLGRWLGFVFLGHVALAMELVLLLPFTQLAHLLYRPVALWFTEFRRLTSSHEPKGETP